MRDEIQGWIGLVVVVVILWWLAYGVTIDGHHYGITLSSERGVEIEK